MAKKSSSETSKSRTTAKPVTKKSAPKRTTKTAERKAKRATKKPVTKKAAPKKEIEVLEVTESELIARAVAEAALSKKAEDIVLLDVRKLTDITDFFVICSADVDRQVKAIADEIRSSLIEQGERPAHFEATEPTWIVIDYIDVVVHVFTKEKRNFYNLEKLWGDGKFTRIQDELAPKKKIILG